MDDRPCGDRPTNRVVSIYALPEYIFIFENEFFFVLLFFPVYSFCELTYNARVGPHERETTNVCSAKPNQYACTVSIVLIRDGVSGE